MALARARASQLGERVALQEQTQLAATTPAEREFKDVYQDAHAPALRLAESLTDYDAACDIVQQVAVELWRRWDQLQPDERRVDNFVRLARNRAIEERKRRRQFVTIEQDDEDHLGEQFFVLPDVGLFHENMMLEQVLAVIVRSMPPARRLAWTLVREARCTYQQAAEMLAISPRTVAKHIEQSHAFIRASLDRAGVRLSDTTIRGLLPPPPTRSSEEQP